MDSWAVESKVTMTLTSGVRTKRPASLFGGYLPVNALPRVNAWEKRCVSGMVEGR